MSLLWSNISVKRYEGENYNVVSGHELLGSNMVLTCNVVTKHRTPNAWKTIKFAFNLVENPQ